ncbi:MAG: type IV pilus assembly protein PilM [Candidatus Staskawiczbacteria bacterium]|nr:type IV pilus assembly protein PilM [Candidatus Staskawiczbacteria bacterium]
MKNPFKNPFMMFFPKKMLGIDVGTSSVKIVEISRWGGGKTLENYGEIKSTALYKEPVETFQRGSYLLSDFFVSRAIMAILNEAKIKTKAAIISVPDFSTFCTSIELPPMAEKEIQQAVYYTAPQYIPLSITETTLDWRIISGTPGQKDSPLKILLIAIPNQVVQGYQKIAQLAGLELYALEAETLAITRALIKDKKKIICLMDIGVQSTTVNIVDKGILKKSYSFSFASNQLTYAISSALGLSYSEAEDLKNQQGLTSLNTDLTQTLYLLIDPLVLQIRKISGDFYQEEGKDIEEIYLTGGTANLPGLKEYFQETFKKNVEIPNCFSDLLYPPILEEKIKKMGPSFSVSVGLSLGGLEV